MKLEDFLEGNPDKPDKTRPRTALLQVGLADKLPYFIHEGEVPRSGIRVEQSYQRTRWSTGSATFTKIHPVSNPKGGWPVIGDLASTQREKRCPRVYPKSW